MAHRIGLVLVILCLGVAIFALPTQVLNNEKTDSPAPMANRDKGQTSETLDEDLDIEHESSLNKADQAIADRLESLANEGNPGAKQAYLDSLITFYVSKGKFFDAAKFTKQKVEAEESFENLKLAGSMFTEAAGFAVDEQKKKKLLEQAEAYLQKASKQKPEDLNLKVLLAEGYVMGDNPMQGIFLLREVLQIEPKHQKALYQMGILSIQSGQWDKAIERLGDYTRYYPEDPEGWFYLGLSYKQLKLNKEAKKSFEKVLELDQDEEVRATVNQYLKDI